MQEIGVVHKIKDDLALVELGGAGSCSDCAGTRANAVKKNSAVLWAKNKGAAKTGDRVAVSIPEQSFKMSSIAVYILPLAAILLGAGVGRWISSQDAVFQGMEALAGIKAASLLLTSDNPSLALGLLFLLAGFWASRAWAQRIIKKTDYQPELVRVLGETDGKAD